MAGCGIGSGGWPVAVADGLSAAFANGFPNRLANGQPVPRSSVSLRLRWSSRGWGRRRCVAHRLGRSAHVTPHWLRENSVRQAVGERGEAEAIGDRRLAERFGQRLDPLAARDHPEDAIGEVGGITPVADVAALLDEGG